MIQVASPPGLRTLIAVVLAPERGMEIRFGVEGDNQTCVGVVSPQIERRFAFTYGVAVACLFVVSAL